MHLNITVIEMVLALCLAGGSEDGMTADLSMGNEAVEAEKKKFWTEVYAQCEKLHLKGLGV